MSRCNCKVPHGYHCAYHPPICIDDDVRFVGGSDVYKVTGYAKTQPKVIIEVNGEAVYVPYECLEVVTTGDRQKLDLARTELERLCNEAPRMRGTRRYVEVCELYTLKAKLK